MPLFLSTREACYIVRQMENILETSPPEYKAKSKRNLLIGVLILTVVSTFALWLAVFSEPVSGAVNIFAGLGYTVAILICCHIDAREGDIPLGPGFRIFVILLGPIALTYYLFRSRGLKRGFVSLGLVLAFFLLIFILQTTVNLILALISDRLGLFVVR